MYFRRELGKKGQVVIPVDIRKNLNLKSGSKVLFEVHGNDVILKADKDPLQLVEEFCDIPKAKKKMTSEEMAKDLHKTLDLQYEEKLQRSFGKKRT